MVYLRSNATRHASAQPRHASLEPPACSALPEPGSQSTATFGGDLALGFVMSQSGKGRVLVPREQKRGIPNWVVANTYAVTYQCWRAASHAIRDAACAVNEATTKEGRNRVTDAGLRLVEDERRINL